MLVHQAVEAQQIWQGRKLPGDLTAKIMQEVHQ
jgi:shikimate 5-dehydrogenase